MLALPVEEAEAVAVTIIGVPLELEVTTEALPGVEVELVDVVDGVESVDELLELDDNTDGDDEVVEDTEEGCGGSRALVTPPMIDLETRPPTRPCLLAKSP